MKIKSTTKRAMGHGGSSALFGYAAAIIAQKWSLPLEAAFAVVAGAQMIASRVFRKFFPD